jgi:hypothetical protein
MRMPPHPVRKVEWQAVFEHGVTLAHASPARDAGLLRQTL